MNILFKDLNVKEEIKEAINSIGLTETTDIQNLVIDEFLSGKDIIAQAKTGTGKTFAFGIPIVEKTSNKKVTESIIMCPTRELALQVFNEVKKLTKNLSYINLAAIVGGESYDRQFSSLKKNPQIIVGTPGRIIDHLERGTIDLTNIKVLAFDEADEMLKMGFKDDIERILRDTPENRQTVLFSATIPNEVKKIASEYQKDAVILKVKESSLTVEAIEQSYYVVKKQDKLNLVERLIDIEGADSVIIFANTKRETDEIAEFLRNKNYNANSLHGDLKQNERSFVTNNFKRGNLKILVATDVAARGLDINNVKLVINYEIPHEKEVYVHRIGRTGRAGLTGKAFTIITPRTEYKIRDLEKFTNAKIDRKDVPSNKAIDKATTNRFVNELKLELANVSEYNYESVINRLTKEGLSLEDISKILIHKLIPTTKTYEEISIFEKKDDNPRNSKNSTNQRNNNDGNNNRRERGLNKNGRKEGRTNIRANFINFKINIGRKDNINPTLMLDLLGSKFNLRNNSVGNIKFYNTYSIIEVNLNDVSKIKKSQTNFNGKKVKLDIEK